MLVPSLLPAEQLLPAALHHLAVLQAPAMQGEGTGVSCAAGLCWVGCHHPVLLLLQGEGCCLRNHQLQQRDTAAKYISSNAVAWHDKERKQSDSYCVGRRAAK